MQAVKIEAKPSAFFFILLGVSYFAVALLSDTPPFNLAFNLLNSVIIGDIVAAVVALFLIVFMVRVKTKTDMFGLVSQTFGVFTLFSLALAPFIVGYLLPLAIGDNILIFLAVLAIMGVRQANEINGILKKEGFDGLSNKLNAYFEQKYAPIVATPFFLLSWYIIFFFGSFTLTALLTGTASLPALDFDKSMLLLLKISIAEAGFFYFVAHLQSVRRIIGAIAAIGALFFVLALVLLMIRAVLEWLKII